MPAINIKNFDIVGNSFRAYYDAQNKLIFVIDSTDDERIPNILLVMSPSGDRKWDDVLANDYGIDLETIRPKVNNRYQKMDIEYSGLAEYDALINAYLAGNDTSDALKKLDKFRAAAAWRAATARLNTANAVATRTADTIARTRDTIADLNATLKQLRAKLSDQRAAIGREPTKQSAAKILRTEAQIDATNAKLRRAKKRLNNAEKRLADAEADANIARAILARGDVSESEPVVQMIPATPAPTAVIPADFDDDDDEYEQIDVQDDDDDAPIEIPPLLESDPQIINEDIAFKPINFDATPIPESEPAPAVNINIFAPESNNIPAEIVTDDTVESESETAFAPIMFTPPTMPEPVDEPEPVAAPEFDSEANIYDESTTLAPIEFRPIVDSAPEIEPETPIEPVATPVLDTIRPLDSDDTPNTTVSPVDIPDYERPMPPAPTSDDTPTLAPVATLATPDTPANVAKKPTALYYLMLVVLIVLSVFTLWMYQNNSNTTTPDLTTATPAVAESTEPKALDITPPATDENPFVTPEPEPAPVPAPEPEPEPEPVAAPEPIPAPEPVDVVVTETVPEPVTVTVPDPEPVDVIVEPTLAPVTPTEAEVIAAKPAYNVSQNQEMFVADDDYGPKIIRPNDTTTPPTAIVPAPVPETYEPSPAPAYNASGTQIVTSEVFDVETCVDGTMPDGNGCCGNEIFTDMEDGTFACCTPDGLDCFPPM